LFFFRFLVLADERVLGSLGDLASVPGVPSEPTLRRLIRDNPDFPVVATGTNGVAYQIDVGAAIAWLRAHEEQRREAEAAQRNKVQQFALELLGPDAAAVGDEAGLSPAERKALLEEELVAIKVAERRGQLIRKASVEEALAAMMVLDAKRRETFTARLAKRLDLPREALTAIDALMEQDRRALAGDMEKLGSITDADAEAGDTAV
jgi:hypothetical protein